MTQLFLSRQARSRTAFQACFTFALIGALALPAMAETPPAATTENTGASSKNVRAAIPDTFTLANGLDVVVIPDHRTPVVTQMIWYHVGSADETPGKSGLAHFLEHLMFKGTQKHPEGEFTKTVARLGGNENAFTFYDYTGYYQRFAKEHLAKMMGFEADRMTGLVLTDEVVLPERDVVLEEMNQRVANNPSARLTQDVMAALYRNHPYGRPVIGWRPEVSQLSREDALAFYKKFYAPNNATLIIAGDVTTDEVRKLAEETFGKVAANKDISRVRHRPQEPEPDAARMVRLSDPRVAQPSLQRYYLVPSPSTARAGESEALEVLAHLLGNGSNSILSQALVTRQGIAANTSAYYQSNGLDSSQFVLGAVPRPGKSLEELEAAMDTVVEAAKADLVPAEELERAKTQLIAESVYARDSQTMLARWYGSSLATGQSVKDVVTWAERIARVSASDVREVARRWLEPPRSVTGYLVGPEPKQAPPSQAQKGGETKSGDKPL